MHFWQLQEAKAKLSQLIQMTLKDGPQGISVHGREEIVVMSKKKYDRLIQQKPDFVSFLRNSPLFDVDIDFQRDKSLPRDSSEL